ncbi:MAG: PAS-domain containing protein [Sphingomonadales bacterium]|nr:PAS-domain containing protein [Sphingomonadales bacterium]MBD3772632.1 PAS-domain containing protein [Paracoccaceae bacterium]
MATRIKPADARDEELEQLREQLRRMEKINQALMDRVERSTDIQGGAFSMFETAIALEAMVRERTTALEEALGQLNAANALLEAAHRDADAARSRLRDAIESLSDGFALFDAEDRLVMCNRAFLKFWPELEDLSDQGAEFAALVERLAQGGRTMGSLISADRWIKERVARHRRAGVHVQAMSDGRWLQISELRTTEGGTVGIYTDITEVKAEDARERAVELAEKTTILQSTLDTIRLGVAVYDADRRLIAWNGQLLSTIGLQDDDLPLVMVHDGMVDACRAVNGPFGEARPLEWLPPGSREVKALRRQASGRVVEVRRASMPGGGMVMTFEDVTERMQAAEMLEKRVEQRTSELVEVNRQLVDAKEEAELANRSKTRFLAAASHDLLQPLNAARLFVSALGERRLAAPSRALVSRAAVALDSVEELLEALFEISRLDAGAIQPEIGSIELDRILSALRIEFAPVARAGGLELDIQPTGLWVRSDIRMLRRVLQNFISNAIRYTAEGKVEVDVREIGDEVVIAIRDTGPGIDPAQHEAVFEEFRRLEGKGKRPGNGLGLAIVRRACAMLGHSIALESELGAGSAFSLTVPRSEPVERPALPPERRERIGASGGGTVLVIDNDQRILEGMCALLGNWGLDVVCAGDPGDAKAVAAARKGLALLIADYHLDDELTGDVAVAQLRDLHQGELPAVIITADRSEEVKSALASQGLPMLTKPVKPAQLRALLRQLATTA